MEFRTEIMIDLPRERVIELFDDPDNLKEWQDGLQSFEHLSGEPGQPGAKSQLIYDMNGRRVEMIETVTVRNLPDEFSGTYEAQGVHNVVKNYFYESGPNQTRWVADNIFEFNSLMMKVMGFLMPGSFKKQSRQFMQDFKSFAERSGG